jgi:hypothetical protein
MSPSEPPLAGEEDNVLVYPDLAGLVMLTNTPVATALAVDAVVAVVADVAVAALPKMLIFQVPEALVPVVLGAPMVL